MNNSMATQFRLTHRPIQASDAYASYRALREELGARNVYLLESLAGPAADRRSAAVGFAPFLSVAVAGDEIRIVGSEQFVGRARAALVDAGAGISGESLILTDGVDFWDIPRVVGALFDVPGLNSSSFGFGYVAFYGYDVVRHIERLPFLIDRDDSAPPDLLLAFYQGLCTFDLESGAATLTVAMSDLLPDISLDNIAAIVSSATGAGTQESRVPAPSLVRDSTTEPEFCRAVGVALQHIAIGDIYQVQLGHEITVESEIDEMLVYERMRRRNPSPYMAVLPVEDLTVISSSPELFLRIEGDTMMMRPIAGTIARTSDPSEDRTRKATLASDEKEVAEHVMLVDLCRNDLSRIAQVDTVEVDELMAVEDYSHVFHLVSNVKASLAPGYDAQDVVAATFPAGTMTGAPKIRAMEIIEDIEDKRRGLYAGAFGLIGLGGYVNLGLCIRTVFRRDRTYWTRASAGVVSDSTPAAEWRETLSKLNAAYWALTDKELL
jgi:anthranilate/para-aminobenzoate synthase component I